MRKAWTRSLLASACLVAGLVAWSNPAAAVPGRTSPANKKTFCALNAKANLELNALFNSAPDNNGPTPAQIQQAQSQLVALFDQGAKTAPPAITDQVKMIDDAVHTDLGAALNNPVLVDAVSKIDAYALKNCGYHVVNVTAKEYRFQGVPKTLKTGLVVINFKNVGAESHEIVLARILTSDSVKSIIALPNDQASAKVESLGATGADPGKSSVGYYQITKTGRYAAVCLIPQGTTSNSQPGTGPAHSTLGMYSEFTVK